ncbi:pilus assembly protein [Aeoliella sp. ICT_H6.2]|uniref:Pilus assembly protein n=1 Tax=Aeoliella straminimaris TaxID=2954799 RepID=A0A9X2JGP3_9BACT|nr:TadE family protein [Aeoliella straminimaris]MCO6045220.1 pilus assembly protein [Aeoliella straminimaris]
MPRRTQKATERSGVAAIEFAFVAPVFFLLIFGLIEASRALNMKQALTNAAREGCRTASLATTLSSDKVDAATRDYLAAVTRHANNPDKVRVTVPSSLATCETGTELTVSIEVDFQDMTWLPLDFMNFRPTISAVQCVHRE